MGAWLPFFTPPKLNSELHLTALCFPSNREMVSSYSSLTLPTLSPPQKRERVGNARLPRAQLLALRWYLTMSRHFEVRVRSQLKMSNNELVHEPAGRKARLYWGRLCGLVKVHHNHRYYATTPGKLTRFVPNLPCSPRLHPTIKPKQVQTCFNYSIAIVQNLLMEE